MASQIISVDTTASQHLNLNPHLIRNILTHKNLNKLKVAIISIAGPYRKGKSFLLNFFLRYLRRARSSDWLRVDVQEVLEGFDWTDGAYEGTSGVWLWPEPLIVDDVAIFLMDTQGSFNSTQSEEDNTKILALTTLVSTVTIYNLQGDLHKNDLDFLHFCTEYGKSALRSEDSYGPGKLVVLVRDWVHSTHRCGFAGGREYVDEFLENQSARVRESLRSNFADVTCFLMPKHVTTTRQLHFAGQLDRLDEEFVSRLGEFIPDIVDGIKENAVLQTGPEVFLRFVTCFDALENMTAVGNRIDLQKMSDDNTAHELAVDEYCKSMSNIIGVDAVPLDPNLLQEAHKNAMGRAIKGYLSRPRMGWNAWSGAGVERLKEHLDLLGRDFASNNDRARCAQVQRRVASGFAAGGVTGALGAIAVCDAAFVVPCACLAVGVGLIGIGVAVYALSSATVPSTLLTRAVSYATEFVSSRMLGMSGRVNAQPRIEKRDLKINRSFNWSNLRNWVIYVLVGGEAQKEPRREDAIETNMRQINPEKKNRINQISETFMNNN